MGVKSLDTVCYSIDNHTIIFCKITANGAHKQAFAKELCALPPFRKYFAMGAWAIPRGIAGDSSGSSKPMGKRRRLYPLGEWAHEWHLQAYPPASPKESSESAAESLKIAAEFQEIAAKSMQSSDTTTKIFPKPPTHPTPL